MSKPDFTHTFLEAIEKRNPQQHEAIEAIDGPVLVLAGPGTGKTDVLSLRIGNILRQTDTEPHNILCLTYTESGAFAMRNRLAQYIGPAAYNVHIHTFHAFCNLIIQENSQAFGFYRDLQPITPLEKMEVLMAMTDDLPPEHPIRRLKGDIYYDSRKMGRLFDLMKQENWSAEVVLAAIDTHIERERLEDKYYYQKKYKEFSAGDFKEATFKKDVLDKMETLRAAAELFPEYQKRMRELERYDFNDMLRWVFEAFNNDPDLLMSYQERFLYFLVDEFQDTNGLQLDLLGQLLSFWEENPNVFVVGDDDQAIFRFQGANVGNITDFSNKYNPKTIVLTENYRSNQQVLNSAMQLIENNKDRLVNSDPLLSKNLRAKGELKEDNTEVRVVRYPDKFVEEASIALQLKELHDTGVLENEDVAVIYRKHSQAEDILRVLEHHRVPVEVRRQVNILEEPIIQNLLLLIRYFHESQALSRNSDPMLYRLMHLRHFKLNIHDVAKIAITRPSGEEDEWVSLRERLSDNAYLDSLQLRDPEAIRNFSEFLTLTQSELYEYTFQVFFEKLITRSGLLNFIYHSPERHWLLQLLTALFDFIKSESERNPSISIAEFLEVIDKLVMHKLWLPAQQLIKERRAVQFITAHSAKGLQFDRVFMLGAIEDNWEKQRGGRQDYSLPATLVPSSKLVSAEDERRLFYVAMTRAKKHLEISFATRKEEGKEVSRSVFIEEILENNTTRLVDGNVEENQLIEYHIERMMATDKQEAPYIDHELIAERLENFELSVTAINKYYECPRKFYFENILRIPSARNVFMGYGSAIHKALERFFNTIKSGTPKSKELLIKMFQEAMVYYKSHFTEKEFEDVGIHGKQVLEAYYDTYQGRWNDPESIQHEYKIKNVAFEGVPLTGFIDRLDLQGNRVLVTDYKTGKFNGQKFAYPSEKYEHGGDYWRQIVFYKILIDLDPRQRWNMQSGVVDFIEPDKEGNFKLKQVDVEPDHIALVGEQIVDVYQSIKAHKFEEGCEQCYWCDLVNNELAPGRRREVREAEEMEF